jgi:hypothetical protein
MRYLAATVLPELPAGHAELVTLTASPAAVMNAQEALLGASVRTLFKGTAKPLHTLLLQPTLEEKHFSYGLSVLLAQSTQDRFLAPAVEEVLSARTGSHGPSFFLDAEAAKALALFVATHGSEFTARLVLAREKEQSAFVEELLRLSGGEAAAGPLRVMVLEGADLRQRSAAFEVLAQLESRSPSGRVESILDVLLSQAPETISTTAAVAVLSSYTSDDQVSPHRAAQLSTMIGLQLLPCWQVIGFLGVDSGKVSPVLGLEFLRAEKRESDRHKAAHLLGSLGERYSPTEIEQARAMLSPSDPGDIHKTFEQMLAISRSRYGNPPHDRTRQSPNKTNLAPKNRQTD